MGNNVIYKPKGQAAEYAEWATNPYRGCGHKCAYCYVPGVLHMSREEFDRGAVERKDYLKRLDWGAQHLAKKGITPQVMLSFTTDPYHPGDTTLTTKTLRVLTVHGFSFCTLTKGGLRAMQDIDMFRPGKDSFACTLTSLDDEFSLKWERAAALPGERIAVLREFKKRGIYTWVSLEPTLNTEASLSIVRGTHEFVDLFKVGRANYLPMTKSTDWESYTHEMVDLMHRLKQSYYIKKDLQVYIQDDLHSKEFPK